MIVCFIMRETMKRTYFLFRTFVVLVFIGALIACSGKNDTAKIPVIEKEAAAVIENESTGIPPEPEAPSPKAGYAGILSRYAKAAAEGWDKWDTGTLDEGGYLLGITDTIPGYAFVDIDGNGTAELVIGSVNGPEGWDTMIYDLWTAVGGKMILLASSRERDRWWWAEGGRLAREGSDSAAYTIWEYYRIADDGDGIFLIEAVKYDENGDNGPWFYYNEASDYGAGEDSYEPVEEDYALRFAELHRASRKALPPLVSLAILEK